MAGFQFSESNLGSVTQLKFIGPIDEGAVFPKVQSNVRTLVIQMGEVTRLNSHGTRQWALWAKTIPAAAEVSLEECPVIFVKSFALIKGVLLPNMSVNSFYVPYFSDETGERKNVLVRRGVDFFDDGRINLPVHKDSKGGFMEVDALQPGYFAFLKK